MSKTLNKLSNIQRERDYPPRTTGTVPKGLGVEHARTSNAWILGIAVTIMFFVMLAYNIRIFNILKLNAFEKDEIFAKTGKIESLLKDYAQEIKSSYEVIKKSADILDKLNLELKEANTRISELKKDNDSLTFAIENLTKAKNTLFNKVSVLETEIEKFKK